MAAPKRVFSARTARNDKSASSLDPYMPSPDDKFKVSAVSARKKQSSPRPATSQQKRKKKSIDPWKPYEGDRPYSGSKEKFRVPSPYLKSPRSRSSRSISPGSKSSSDGEERGPQFAYGGQVSSTPKKTDIAQPFPSRYNL